QLKRWLQPLQFINRELCVSERDIGTIKNDDRALPPEIHIDSRGGLQLLDEFRIETRALSGKLAQLHRRPWVSGSEHPRSRGRCFSSRLPSLQNQHIGSALAQFQGQREADDA